MKPKKELIGNILLLKDCIKLKHPQEYILNLKNKQQELLIFGCPHSFDPTDKKFQEIEFLFKEFYHNNKKKKIEVVVERFIPPVIKSKTKMIQNFDDTGFIAYLARPKKIEVFCPEPTSQEILNFVLQRGCDKINIAAWVLLNILCTKKILNIKNIGQIIVTLIQIKKQLGLKDEFLNSIVKKINSVAKKKILPLDFKDLVNKKLPVQIICQLQNPSTDKTIFNRVGAEINLARDYFFIIQILSRLKKGKSIFGVLGTNHVVAQEKVYRKFFRKNNEV
jgi:hypothetical protein